MMDPIKTLLVGIGSGQITIIGKGDIVSMVSGNYLFLLFIRCGGIFFYEWVQLFSFQFSTTHFHRNVNA